MAETTHKRSRKLQHVLLTLAMVLTCYFGLQFFNFSAPSKADDGQYTNYINEHYKIFALDMPDTLSFAGESVPMNLVDVKERFDREMLVNTYWQSQGLLFHKRANRWFPTIEKIFKEEGVPEDFKYLAVAESGLSNVISSANAVGFWQFLRATGKQYNLEIRDGVDERYNVEKSTRAAAQMLKNLYKKYDSWTMAAAAYNLGQGNLDKQIARQNANNYYDLLLVDETSRYVFRIMAIKEILSNSNKYGFHFRPQDLYQPYQTRTINIDSSVKDFAVFAKDYGITYKTLKILNPWLRDSFLNNASGKVYALKIPAEDYHDLK